LLHAWVTQQHAEDEPRVRRYREGYEAADGTREAATLP
jgi:hypothetical protein